MASALIVVRRYPSSSDTTSSFSGTVVHYALVDFIWLFEETFLLLVGTLLAYLKRLLPEHSLDGEQEKKDRVYPLHRKFRKTGESAPDRSAIKQRVGGKERGQAERGNSQKNG